MGAIGPDEWRHVPRHVATGSFHANHLRTERREMEATGRTRDDPGHIEHTNPFERLHHFSQE
jgi:hypothetical protein